MTGIQESSIANASESEEGSSSNSDEDEDEHGIKKFSTLQEEDEEAEAEDIEIRNQNKEIDDGKMENDEWCDCNGTIQTHPHRGLAVWKLLLALLG